MEDQMPVQSAHDGAESRPSHRPTGPTPTGPRGDRWLFGPAPDLLLGCGLGYAWIFCALVVFDTRFLEAIPMGFLPFILLISGTPHYGATLLRVYEQRETRRAYALFSVGATAILAACFVGSLYFAMLGSVLMTIYFNWNPWHYAGQNYGLALMFLRRRQVEVTPLGKRLLYATFILSAILAIVEMNGFAATTIYAPVGEQIQAKTIGPVYEFISIGFSPDLQRGLSTVGLALYAGCVLATALVLLRGGTLRDLGPSAAIVATQSLWFVIPGAARLWGVLGHWVPLSGQHFNYALIWIAIGHSVQYLWVTTYYAKKTDHYGGIHRYFARCILAGALIWQLPALVFAPGVFSSITYTGGFSLLIATIVNLHHFVLDGAIWKLRDSRIAQVLIRSESETPLSAESSAESIPAARPWLRPALWSLGVICVATLALAAWEREVGFRQASRRADYARMEQAAQRLKWIGQPDSVIHRHLAAVSTRRGRPDEAVRQYELSLEIRDHPKAHFELGEIHAGRGDWSRASDAYEAAYRIDPFPVSLIVRLSEALIQSGRLERAREVLREGLTLHPGQLELKKLESKKLEAAQANSGRRPGRGLDSERDRSAVSGPFGALIGHPTPLTEKLRGNG